MSSRPPRNNLMQLVPWFGFLLAVGSVVYNSGQITGDVRRNTDRISKIEAQQSATSADINAINVRTARIEAKLDFVIPQKGAER